MIHDGPWPHFDSQMDWKIKLFTKIMQFTGLKDKNGVEIYEGDVVQYYMLDSKDTGKAIESGYVEYVEEMASFVVDDWKQGLKESNGMLLHKVVDMAGDNLMIIGNIYENPELVEEHITPSDQSSPLLSP